MKKAVMEKKITSDYKLNHFGERGTILSHAGQPVFIISSGVELREDFVVRLIEAYSQSPSGKLS
jgi:hypothetical protein